MAGPPAEVVEEDGQVVEEAVVVDGPLAEEVVATEVVVVEAEAS